ncbi:hypothetical protein [Sphingomonas kyeonggiensis]|uniref:Uncharacterized protein n=1 Tax=Sphingomonas kyeonggiensis TaxID=1268553 RepID=A0A7W6NWA1_9SPHN|nr:hypothetical protein [Sphingomonas kyeonggiensis]MBB4097461.1 hypothetical protein [Sphingomonas kyeonggiensis]
MTATKGLVGGPATIAGILFQMFRSLAAGFDAVVEHVRSDEAGAEALLTLEPPAGDLHRESDEIIIEQIKMRRGIKPWSAGEIAEEVFPDLIKAVPAAPTKPQLYRFTTDRDEGLTELRDYAAAMRGNPLESPDALDDGEKCFRYGRARQTARSMFLRLAYRAGANTAAARRRLWAVLRSFEIVTVAEDRMIGEIDRLIAILADNEDLVEFHRGKLLSDVLGLARSSASLRMSTLLRNNHLDPERLLHIARLPRMLADTAAKDATTLQYRPGEEARASTLRMVSAVSLLGGESGQGKTWVLCRAALAEASEGRPVVLLAAQGTVAAIEAEIVKRVWLPNYSDLLPLVTVAKRLRPGLEDKDGYWLTVYLDDLHDRALARELIAARWSDLGIRLVLSAQPGIEDLLSASWEISVYSIPNFDRAELRGFLERAGRDPAPIPDDVVDWLARPILAATFVRLPETTSWSDPDEYRLMEAYWAFATRRYRDQPEHKSDGEGLKALAGTLLGEGSAYPFPIRLRRTQLDDEAVRRLILVGLVQENDDGLSFAHDRLLNWALACAITDRVVDRQLDQAALETLVRGISDLRTRQGDPLGNRLGYVLLDLIWNLAVAGETELLASFLLSHAREIAMRSGEELFLSHNLATIGAPIIPAIRRMVDDPMGGGNEWLWRPYLARALRSIARSGPQQVRQQLLPLLDSPLKAQRIFALNALRAVPAIAALDRMLEIHIEHSVILKRKDDADAYAQRHANHQISFAALTTAAKANPDWIDGRAEESSDPAVLEQLLWILLNIEQRDALPIWMRHKAKLINALGMASFAVLRAIREFADHDEIARLDVPLETADRHAIALQIDALVRLDPDRALARIAKTDMDDLSGTSSWWLDALVHRTGKQSTAVLRPRERIKYEPFHLSRGLFQPRMELVDIGTLDIFLDEFELRLNDPVEEGEDPLGNHWRTLDFIASLCTPEQIDCVLRRRGTGLEASLAARASQRLGRTSRVMDTLGNNARNVLAMMAGDGFDQLAVAEMRRASEEGKEDGLLTALWSDSPEVTQALRQFSKPDEARRYREVLLYNALAAHRSDAGLAALVAAGGPVYNKAAEIRSSRPPMDDAEAATYFRYLKTGTVEKARLAINMAAFSGRRDLLDAVIEAVLKRRNGDLLQEAIGVFRHNGLYDPRLLPRLAPGLDTDEKGGFNAFYLAACGDAEARQAVVRWLETLPERVLQHQEFSVVEELLEHQDSAESALSFLRRRLRGRARDRQSQLLIRLAESGDREAQEAVRDLAFRSPSDWGDHPIGAIRHLGVTSPAEAFAAAERLFVRHREPIAARMLLELDSVRALPIVLTGYAERKQELRWWLARLLRWWAPKSEYRALLEAWAISANQAERLQAAELAQWLPHSEPVDFLELLAEDRVRDIEMAALAALRRRSMEASAAELMTQLQGAPRPLAWSKMRAIIRLVDPYLLGHPGDPLWLGNALRDLPAEFRFDAEDYIAKAKKKVADEGKKHDKARFFD